MKNNYLKVLLFLFFADVSHAENFDISAKNISIDKKNEITILKNDVVIKDKNGNIIKSELANYNKKKEIISSKGKTFITTSEGYIVETEDLVYDNLKGLSSSNKRTIIKDQENNLIYLNNFEYQLRLNIFKSIGDIKVIDNMENSYEFSQIYIDEKKKRNNWIRRKNIF